MSTSANLEPAMIWWETFKGEAIPSNAIVFGHSSSNHLYYVGRGYTSRGNLVPGEIHASDRVSCHIADKGRLIVLESNFEILLGCNTDRFQWVAACDGGVPTGAIAGGRIKTTGEELFIARGCPEDDQQSLRGGRLQPSCGFMCYVSDLNKEVRLEEYEVLCEKSDICDVL